MRIAIPLGDSAEVFQHFGHTEKFKVYDIDRGLIVNKEIIETNGQGHGALASLLQTLGVDLLICGGIGGGAQMALAEMGIKLMGGVSGIADEVVNDFLFGTLEYNPQVKCNHHDNNHGGEGHNCGEHGCGTHHCGGHCGNH